MKAKINNILNKVIYNDGEDKFTVKECALVWAGVIVFIAVLVLFGHCA